MNSHATAPTFTANDTVGSYEVTASVAGADSPAIFDLQNVDHDAVIDGTPGVNQGFLSSAGQLGSVVWQGSTLTDLTSFTFNGHHGGTGSDILIVTVPSTGPLLPGPISFNATPGTGNFLVVDASYLTDPGSGFITQQGRIIASGQTVAYSNTPTLTLQNGTGVNAAVLPNTADRGKAFAIGPPGPHGLPTPLEGNERFVQALYLDVLGRAGTLAEVEGWASPLYAPGASQAAVAAGIEGSFEARDHLVNSWYATYLGRKAQAGEELGWVNELSTQTEEQVLSRILASPEFFDHAQGLISTGTPTERYVQALYQVLLGWSASSSEAAGWNPAVAALGNQGAALAFLHTQEFRTDQFEGYYNALLRRPDDVTGLDGWVNSSLDMHTTRIGFEGGTEFYTNG
jgi:hypothetical protein